MIIGMNETDEGRTELGRDDPLLSDLERRVLLRVLDAVPASPPEVLSAEENVVLRRARSKIAHLAPNWSEVGYHVDLERGLVDRVEDVPSPAPVRKRPLLADPGAVYEAARLVSKVQAWAAVLKICRSLAERGADAASLLRLLADDLEHGRVEDRGLEVDRLLGPES